MVGKIACVAVFCSLCGCTLSSLKVEDILMKMKAEPMDLNTNEFHLVLTKNADNVSSRLEERYKLVVYSDSNNCSGCYIDHLSRWNDFLYLENDGLGVNFYFIIEARNNETEKLVPLLEDCDLRHAIYIDENSSFRKSNPNLPEESFFHTFLLDQNNNVLLVGNPLSNERMENLYLKTILQ